MASGDTLAIFYPGDNEPPSSNFSTPDTRNQHPTLDHDDTVNESSVFTWVVPRNYDGGGITAYHHYSMTSATTGNVDIDGSFERIGDGQQDIDSDGFAAAQSTDDTTVPGTSGNVDVTSIAFTDGAQIDSIAVGESARYKFTRDAVSDTATGDLELVAIELKET